jgi:steroid delta-isomerase-like uncharacterized protein
MSEEIKAVETRFIEEALNEKNLAAADKLVAQDIVELDPFPGQEQGREGLKEVLGMLFAAFPDQHWTIEELIAEGDKVVNRFTWRGTHRGKFMGIPPTGRKVEVKGVVIDHIAQGRIADTRILMDNLGLMQQLGVVPAPEQAKA